MNLQVLTRSGMLNEMFLKEQYYLIKIVIVFVNNG